MVLVRCLKQVLGLSDKKKALELESSFYAKINRIVTKFGKLRIEDSNFAPKYNSVASRTVICSDFLNAEVVTRQIISSIHLFAIEDASENFYGEPAPEEVRSIVEKVFSFRYKLKNPRDLKYFRVIYV